MKEKILLAAPTSSHKDYITLDWLNYIQNLTFQDLDIYFVDNSRDNGKYASYIRSLGFQCDHYEPGETQTSNNYICHCQNMIREKFLKGNYTHLFSLEWDQFPPDNIIEYLLCFDKPIISVPYFVFTGYNSMIFINKLIPFYGEYIKIDYHPVLSFTFMDGNIKKSFANGIGCSLIKREVIEKIPFRIRGEAHSDTYFYEDLHQAGIDNLVTTDLITYHYNADWSLISDYYDYVNIAIKS